MAKKRRVVRNAAPKESELATSLVKSIRGACGESSALLLKDFEDPLTSRVKQWIPTGFRALDMIMSSGRGIPVGKIIEIYGDESTGKTALGQYFIKEFQRKGGVAVYLDYETSLDQAHLKGYGIDLGNLIYVDVETVEEGFDAIISVLKDAERLQKDGADTPILIVFDSVAMAIPKAEMEEKGHDSSHVGLLARAMSKGMRKIRRRIAKTNCTCVFVNQTRMKIGVKFGDKTATPGGKALPFAASIRLKTAIFKTLSKTRKGKKIKTGYHIGIFAKKTRFAPPHQTGVITLSFTTGPDPVLSMVQYLKDIDVLKVAGKNMKFVETGETFPRKAWRSFYKEHKKEITAAMKAAEKDLLPPDDDESDEE